MTVSHITQLFCSHYLKVSVWQQLVSEENRNCIIKNLSSVLANRTDENQAAELQTMATLGDF